MEKRLQILDDFSSSESDNNDSDSDGVEDEDNDNDNDNDDDDDDLPIELPSTSETNKINLDVSTLICLVSELTHGGHIYKYPNNWLEVPARMERIERLAPKLENYMKGVLDSGNDFYLESVFFRKRIVYLSNRI